MIVLSRIVPLSICLVFAALIACQPKPTPMTDKEVKYMQTLTKKMSTRCVGRYLVDMPEQLVLHSDGGQEIEDVSILVKPMSESDFKLMLSARKSELENAVMRGNEKYPFLERATALPANAHGYVFDRAENVDSGGRVSRTLELLAWKAGYQMLATISATDNTFPEYANDSLLQTLKTTTPKQLVRILDVFHRARGRADNEIPTGQGVCIPNGFVSGPATEEESVTIGYHLENTEDVFFTFNTDSTHIRDDTLAERGKNIQSLIEQGNGRMLRRGQRSVSGVSEGEEFLYKILGDLNSERKQIMTYKFVFEGNNKIGSAKTPLISIDFDNGEQRSMSARKNEQDFPPPITKATLSEAEALALWDAVIPTIHPRPGAF